MGSLLNSKMTVRNLYSVWKQMPWSIAHSDRCQANNDSPLFTVGSIYNKIKRRKLAERGGLKRASAWTVKIMHVGVMIDVKLNAVTTRSPRAIRCRRHQLQPSDAANG